jgi:hypothetical protein
MIQAITDMDFLPEYGNENILFLDNSGPGESSLTVR